MPAALHRELEKRADRLGLSGDRRNAYIYGTLQGYDKRHRAKVERQAAMRHRARKRAKRKG